MTERTNRPATLGDLINNALWRAAQVAVGRLDRAVRAGQLDRDEAERARDAIADDVEHIGAHADPNAPGARLRWGWQWDDRCSDREAARSLVVEVTLLDRAGRPGLPLGCWRVRGLSTTTGEAIDVRTMYEHLCAQLAVEVPDHPGALTDAPQPTTRRQDEPPSADAGRVRRTLKRRLSALDPGRPCCTRRVGRPLTAEHAAAHAWSDAIAEQDRDAARAEGVALLAELRGRAA